MIAAAAANIQRNNLTGKFGSSLAPSMKPPGTPNITGSAISGWIYPPDNNQIVVLTSYDLLLLNCSLEPWQLRGIPSTADGFDEEDAGIHASPLNVDVIALLCQ
jgi:hypothetical protein